MTRLPSRTINIGSLGPVLFEKSKRAKRPNITIRPYKGIRVAVPQRLSFKRAKEFLLSHLDWTEQNLEYVRKVEKEHKSTINDFPLIDKKRAKSIIVKRLDCLAQEHGLKYNRVFIRNQKTRWGSCSSSNNINLNVNIVSIREELMDYVILHELVHTEILNHSKHFWSRLDRCVANAKILDKELGKHRFGCEG